MRIGIIAGNRKFPLLLAQRIKQKDKELSDIPSVIIPAAGENPELKHILGDAPKPLYKIGGKNILEHDISLFSKFGIDNQENLKDFLGEVVLDLDMNSKIVGIEIIGDVIPKNLIK